MYNTNLDQRLLSLQKSVAHEFGGKVDCYYQEGYGALFIPHGYPLRPYYVILAVPEVFLIQGL